MYQYVEYLLEKLSLAVLDVSCFISFGVSERSGKDWLYMSITIKDFLKLLPESNLIAGKGGLYRSIDTVVVLDVPNGEKWVKGNELILSSGYLFKSCPEQFKDFIQDIATRGAAGFVIKAEQSYVPITQDVLNFADHLNLPNLMVLKHTLSRLCTL